MELKELLGSSFECRCGKTHTVPTEKFFYAEDAFGSITGLIDTYSPASSCLIIADSRTYGVAGREIADLCKNGGAKCSRFIVPDHGGESPTVDDTTRDLLLKRTADSDFLLALGSGVINDLVKWVAFLQHKPYIVVATAASMNGYASANVAATIDGLKVLFHATPPKAVIATPDILLNAPYELSAAGLGDVLAKPVSSADWRLNHFLFEDYFCQFSIDLLKDLEPVYLKNPDKIRNRDSDAFKALFTALFYSSIAMTITGTSSPASGGEHLVSHTLDMLATRNSCSHDLHGRQVGVSSILMAALYERILTIDQPRFSLPPSQVDETFWGALTPVVAKEYEAKLPKMSRAVEILNQPGNWEACKSAIKPHLIPARQLKECLRHAGAVHRYSDLRFNKAPVTQDFFVSVVSHASQMRSRFTILDIAVLLEIIPEETEELIVKWCK
ncbi:MAG: iron-containing alcohol dehydrogenase [Desulfofustis sp.]|nr:iron-containing alcohol dehydrogenase [Desulfofustis sp.]